MFEWIFLQLNQPLASWLLSEFILVWGFSHWLMLRFRHLLPIEQMISSGIESLRRQGGPREFAEHFSQVDVELTNNPLFARSWISFRNQLIPPKMGHIVVTNRSPEEFFHFDKLIEERVDVRYYRAIPGYLVGFGFLITFAALIAGLFFATKGLTASAAEANHSRQILSLLLNTVSFKFFSAFVGILCGLFFNWGQRHYFNQLSQNFTHFCRLLEERLEPMRPSTIPSTEVNQEELLDRLVTHLDRSMLDLRTKTIKALQGSVRPLLDELRQEGERLISRQEESLDEMVEKVAWSIKPKINEGAEQIRHATKRLDATTSSLEERFAANMEGAMTPVLNLLREEIGQVSMTQEKLLRHSLSEVTGHLARQGDRDHLETNLIAEVERLANRQEHIVQQGLNDLTTRFKELFSLDLLAERFQAEGARLLPNQERVIRESIAETLERLKSQAFLEPMLQIVRSEGSRLTKHNETVIQEVVAEAATRLRSQVSEETDRLRITSTRLERSGSELEESVRSCALSAMESLSETVRGEGERMANKSGQIFREVLAETAQQIRTHVGESSGEILRANTRLDRTLAALGERTERAIETVRTTLLETIDSEQNFREEMRNTSRMDHVLATIRELGTQLSESQNRSLREVLDGIAIKGVDGQMTMEPLLAAVRSEGERLLERQGGLIRQTIEKFAPGLQSLSLESIVAAVKTQTLSLSERLENKIVANRISLTPILETLQTENAHLLESQERILRTALADSRVSMAPFIDVVRTETERLAQSQEQTLREAMLTRGAMLDPVLKAVHEQGQRLMEAQHRQMEELLLVLPKATESKPLVTKEILASLRQDSEQHLIRQQDALLKTILEQLNELRSSLSIETLMDSLRTVSRDLSTQVTGTLQETLANTRLSLDPILKAFEAQGVRMAESQSQALQSALNQVAVRGTDGSVSLEPILAAIQSQQEHLLDRQTQIMNTALDAAALRFKDSFTVDSVIQAVVQQTEANMTQLAERMTAHLPPPSTAPDGEQVSLEAVLKLVRTEAIHLAEMQESLIQKALVGAKVDLDPILHAVREQGDRLEESQQHALRAALDGVTVQGEKGSSTMDPLLAAVKASTRESTQQNTQIQQTLEKIAVQLRESIALDLPAFSSNLLSSLRAQTEGLAQRLELKLGVDLGHLSSLLTQSHAETSQSLLALQTVWKDFNMLDPLLTAIQEQGEKLAANQ
ncbi:MAG: hypothetical protein H7832_09730, partial [Magnetococcus sp. DMHC-6]